MGSDNGDGLRLYNQQKKEYKRSDVKNGLRNYQLQSRARWINEGTIIIDEKYYYYMQSKKARVKGSNKRYDMNNFTHFYNVFLKPKDENFVPRRKYDDKDKFWRYVSKDGKVRYCRVLLTESAKSLKKEEHIFENDQLCCSKSEWEKRQDAVAAYLTDECWRDFTIC
jgi:hypothetical protein